MKRWNMSLRFVCNSEELLERKFPSVLHRQWSISILADPQPHIDVWPSRKGRINDMNLEKERLEMEDCVFTDNSKM